MEEQLYIVEVFDPSNPSRVERDICTIEGAEKYYIKKHWKDSYKRNMRTHFKNSIKTKGNYSIHDYPTVIITPLETHLNQSLERAYSMNQYLEDNKHLNTYGLSNRSFFRLLQAFDKGYTYEDIIEYGLLLLFH